MPNLLSGQRIYTLDLMRTLAIVLMVVFHFIYDLRIFSLIDTDIPDGTGWQQFRWVIISLFFLCLGASLFLTHHRAFYPRKFFTRVCQISAAALVISVGSYVFIPQHWIFFGVLHFLAIASLFAIFFVRIPTIALVVGNAFLLAGIMQWVPTRWPFHMLFDGLPDYTNDYVAFVPWFGMVLIGIYMGSCRWFVADPCKAWFSHKIRPMTVWPGQHSLSIYLLHQPILIGILYVITRLF